jgi:hypothetical protein
VEAVKDDCRDEIVYEDITGGTAFDKLRDGWRRSHAQGPEDPVAELVEAALTTIGITKNYSARCFLLQKGDICL